jgi:hypothetical protein
MVVRKENEQGKDVCEPECRKLEKADDTYDVDLIVL